MVGPEEGREEIEVRPTRIRRRRGGWGVKKGGVSPELCFFSFFDRFGLGLALVKGHGGRGRRPSRWCNCTPASQLLTERRLPTYDAYGQWFELVDLPPVPYLNHGKRFGLKLE